jgi:UDP-N-acetylmuramoylalanine--D-glutamate ligase
VNGTRAMRVMVMGLGVAGLATVRDLLRRGFRVAVSEQCAADGIAPEVRSFLDTAGVELETGGHTTAFLAGAGMVVPGPGVPLNAPVLVAARGRDIPIRGELALAAGRFPVPVIAVTGSNGKTTVTSLIGELLRASGKRPFVGGNIGTPLLDFFEEPERFDIAVLELSSFQLDLLGDFRPDIGLLLNITPDHLDRHGSLAAYATAKRRLFQGQRPGDTALVSGNDSLAAQTPVPAGVRRLVFGTDPACAARIDGCRVCIRMESGGEEDAYDLEQTRLHSPVNRLNAAAAILAATVAGCTAEGIAAGLASYVPPPHRMAEVGTVRGIRCIDDSKATNIGALAAALEGCDGPVALIAGGRDKGGDYRLLRDVVQRKVGQLVLLGEAAELMAAALADLAPVIRVGSMAEAVDQALEAAEPGWVVLLAPGCSSFDMFSGYAERGRVFTERVRAAQRQEEEG